MRPEERTVRHGLLKAWREARRANLSFPQEREMTQEQMDEQHRLEGEQEKALVRLAEFDAARAHQERHDENEASSDRMGR